MIKKISQTTPVSANIVDNYSTSTQDGYSCNYANEHFGGEILYENNSGTNDNVSLSKNISNYSYIEIYGNKASCYGFTKVPAIAGLSFGLAIHNTYDTRVIQQIFGKYHFNSNGLQIVKEREVYMNDNGSPDVSNDIYITRVIGYK